MPRGSKLLTPLLAHSTKSRFHTHIQIPQAAIIQYHRASPQPLYNTPIWRRGYNWNWTGNGRVSACRHSRATYYSTGSRHPVGANKSTLLYLAAVVVSMLGLCYAAVPLYRMFCQATGYGGTVLVDIGGKKVEKMKPVRERELVIRFNANTGAAMQWQFRPQQNEIKVVPGETALAFFTATNPTDEALTGISTYNVLPFEAGQYFNKVQCFCFEEQRLNPHEEVDMPVFFYIDPEFNDDPAMVRVNTITLSYTFFPAREDMTFDLQRPHFLSN